MKKILLLFAICFTIFSCNKGPGEGGNASIVGRVMIDYRLVLTNEGTYQYSAPARDQSVFIIYGDHISPDNEIETNHEGDFEFRNLRRGEYTVYVYSGDITGTTEFENNRMPVVKTFEITERDEEVDLATIVIYDTP